MSNTVSLLGIPYDRGSSYLRGSSEAPAAIRKALHCPSSNYFSEDETNLEQHPDLQDVGDVRFPEQGDLCNPIEIEIGKQLAGNRRVLSLGGDHSVTYPILKAYAAHFGPLNVLQLDAHPDLYDELDGNRFSHACPFARAHEDGLIRRHIQAGIRTMTAHQREQATRFGVEVITMSKIRQTRIIADGPWYLTLDLDVLDPAFAPGTSHQEPGGMSVRDVLTMIQSLSAEMIGADVVELNPACDENGRTARVAAKIVKEILAKMLAQPLAAS